MANTNPYETLYGVGMLDDLHNYFPAVLYDSSRFRGVQDLLHYIQVNARNRFDLFSFGQRAFLNNSLESSQPIPANTNAPHSQTNRRNRFEEGEELPAGGARARSVSPEARISAHIDILHEDLGFDNQALSLLNLLNVLGTIPRRQAVPNSFMEPVIVRPTEEQVEAGSSREFPPTETTCAICQDSIPVNQLSRRLTACGHAFHISCIDQWFQRDVRCPTCRHDIREPAVPVNEPASDRTEDQQ